MQRLIRIFVIEREPFPDEWKGPGYPERPRYVIRPSTIMAIPAVAFWVIYLWLLAKALR